MTVLKCAECGKIIETGSAFEFKKKPRAQTKIDLRFTCFDCERKRIKKLVKENEI